MAVTRISGNQIADSTNATIKNLAFVAADLNSSPQIIPSFILPVGTTALLYLLKFIKHLVQVKQKNGYLLLVVVLL